MNKIRIGIIGFGRMGRKYLKELIINQHFEIIYICDRDENLRIIAEDLAPKSAIFINDSDLIFNDSTIDAVVLCESSASRFEHIKKAIATRKHILAEKPIARTAEQEIEIDNLVNQYDKVVTVNLFNRNAAYHKRVIGLVKEGEIGELAIVKVCQLTPGLAPTEGHNSEGPAFHDCGMHYVDVARWYADSEYDRFHAVGVRMWNYKEPWWINCHGTFKNGIVFDITQGHNYGQMSKDLTESCYVDLIGTKGVAHIDINVKDCKARVSVHGITQTIQEDYSFVDKNLDVMIESFAQSIDAAHNLGLPTIHDSVVASTMAWRMFDDAINNEPSSIGSLDELEEIKERRRHLTNGYGLLWS